METTCIKCGVLKTPKNSSPTNLKKNVCSACREHKNYCKVVYADVKHELIVREFEKIRLYKAPIVCKKCNAPLSEKNTLKVKNQCCKYCAHKANSCIVKYESNQLQEEARINNTKISRLINGKKPEVKKRRSLATIKSRKKNKEKYRAYARQHSSAYIKKTTLLMTDYYIKSLISHKHTVTPIEYKDVTPELIELKRKHLTLKRYVQQEKSKNKQRN